MDRYLFVNVCFITFVLLFYICIISVLLIIFYFLLLNLMIYFYEISTLVQVYPVHFFWMLCNSLKRAYFTSYLITSLVIDVHFASSFTPSPVSLHQISANMFLQTCVSMYFVYKPRNWSSWNVVFIYWIWLGTEECLSRWPYTRNPWGSPDLTSNKVIIIQWFQSGSNAGMEILLCILFILKNFLSRHHPTHCGAWTHNLR